MSLPQSAHATPWICVSVSKIVSLKKNVHPGHTYFYFHINIIGGEGMYHKAIPILLSPENLLFKVARVMACSNSSGVKGASCAVTCFERPAMSMPLSCWESLFDSVGAEGTAVGWSERDVLAVPASSIVLAATLFSRLVLLELLASSSNSVCCLNPECSCSCTLGRRLCALLCAALWLFVPPGENVPLSARLLRLLAVENASAMLNACKEAA